VLRSLRATLYLSAAGDGIAVIARRNLEDHRAVLFAGEFDGKIDSHRRLAIPAVFAGELSGGVVVARGFERCISIYSAEGWERIASEIRELPVTNAETRRLARFIFASANEQEPDRQGRIELPRAVLLYAGITTEVSVIGTGDAVEVWDRDSWAAQLGTLHVRVAGSSNSLDVFPDASDEGRSAA